MQPTAPPTSSPNKTALQKKALLELILLLLSPKQVHKLREAYAEGKDTIAELSQRSGCPPVLLYSVLTPLWAKTALKLRLFRIERQVVSLKNKGLSDTQIAKQLKLSIDIVNEHSDKQYEESTYQLRPWYTDRAPRPRGPNDLEYDEDTLPPTSRLGWMDGMLTDIPAAVKGRCETCGRLVFMPCLECRVKRDMQIRTISSATEFLPEDEEDGVVEDDLLFN